mmetsp:Transcript_27366/g.56073  ORF Transcript_27366/g.56073 Transcript_27366/m.56073 type:complete len:269 (-) Transcript_27366:22-828(-)
MRKKEFLVQFPQRFFEEQIRIDHFDDVRSDDFDAAFELSFQFGQERHVHASRHRCRGGMAVLSLRRRRQQPQSFRPILGVDGMLFQIGRPSVPALLPRQFHGQIGVFDDVQNLRAVRFLQFSFQEDFSFAEKVVGGGISGASSSLLLVLVLLLLLHFGIMLLQFGQTFLYRLFVIVKGFGRLEYRLFEFHGQHFLGIGRGARLEGGEDGGDGADFGGSVRLGYGFSPVVGSVSGGIDVGAGGCGGRVRGRLWWWWWWWGAHGDAGNQI